MKSLLLLGSALSMLSSGVSAKSPQRNHVVEYDTYQVTYKYETNEVNTINDLVIGNVYEFYNPQGLSNLYISDFLSFDDSFQFMPLIDFAIANETNLADDSDFNGVITQNNYISCDSNDNWTIFVSYDIENQTYMKSIDLLECFLMIDSNTLPFIYMGGYDLVSLDPLGLRATTYNVIESVEPIQHNTSVLGFVYDFVYEDIFDIPNIENYSFSVFGAETSLRSWLTITFCIIIGCLLIWLLIWFVRYIFRLFAGLLH